MNNEPCVRLGMRISPKINEKPAESRKRRPPSVMLLTANTSVWFIVEPECPGSALQRRVVARVDRLRQEPLRVIGPELADLGIGLDGNVHQLAVLLFNAPDIIIEDDVAVVVEG